MLTLDRTVANAPAEYRDITLGPNQDLFSERAQATELYRVESGQIKIVHSSTLGRDTILELLFPGDFFDLPSLLGSLAYSHRASTLSGSGARVRCYPKRVAVCEPSLLGPALTQCLERVGWQRLMAAAMATQSVEQRVAMTLCRLASRCGRVVSGQASFEMPLTRQEFGEFIGSATETGIRSLSQMRLRGWIVCEGKTVTIRCQDQLQAVAAAQ